MGKRVRDWLAPSQLNGREFHRRQSWGSFCDMCSHWSFKLGRVKGRMFRDSINKSNLGPQNIQIYYSSGPSLKDF